MVPGALLYTFRLSAPEFLLACMLRKALINLGTAALSYLWIGAPAPAPDDNLGNDLKVFTQEGDGKPGD